MTDADIFIVVPHGVAYEEFKAASASEVPQMQISKGAIAFMFESSRPFTISEYAWKSNKMHEHNPKMWDNLVGKLEISLSHLARTDYVTYKRQLL